MATAPSAIDVTAATDSGINTDDITSNTTPVITGTGVAGEVITISSDLDGQLVGSVTVPAGGTWTFPVITPLSEGEHTLTITATDAVPATATETFTVEIDTMVDAPVITTFVNDTSNAAIAGTDTDKITSDTTPTISGTAEADSAIEVFLTVNGVTSPVPGGDIDVTDMANGNWSYEPTTPLAPGDYTVTVRATDVAGNVSDSSMDFDFTIDTAQNAPTNIAISDDNGSSTTDNVTSEVVQTISGNAEAGDVIVISVDGVAITPVSPIIADASGDWSYEHTFPTNTAETGVSHTITATAEDAAGNVSVDSAGYTFVLDVTAPNEPAIVSISDDTNNALIAGTDTDGITSDDTLSITGTADDNSAIEVFIDGVAVGTTVADGNGDWTFDHSGVTLPEGDYTVTATATDLAGNVSNPSADFDIKIDTTADTVLPAVTGITIDSGATGDGITDDGTTNITGTVAAGSSVQLFVSLNGAPSTPVPDVEVTIDYGAGTWSYDPAAGTLPDGTYTLTAQSTDSAGNVSATSTAFDLVIDSTDPIAPTVSSISADTGSNTSDNVTMTGMQTISGTAEKGSTVDVLVDAASIGTVTADASTGAWSINHDFGTNAAANGTAYAITATATDAAGNTGPASPALNVTVDTTAPTASPIALDAGSVSPNGVVTVTDEAAPTFSFTAENNSTLEIDYGDGNGFVAAGTGTGALQTVTKPAAYATEGSKTVTLRATDLAGNQTTVAALAITVNLIATDLELSNNLIIDSATDGTVVGSVEVTDGTPSDTHTYVLTNNDGGNFVLNGTTLEVDGTPTFAANVDRTIEIQVTDGAGNVYTETMTVEVEAQPTVGNNGGNAAGEAVTGTFTADNIDAGAGEDTISTGFGEDTVTTGDGADVIQDSATNLNGDTVTDFDDEDEFVFTGAQFDFNDLTFTAGAGGAPSTLAIDSDGDGTADTTITLNEALTGGNFLVFQQGSETKVSYEQSLLALGEGTSIATDAENGIVSQSFLTGDGTNTYNVSLDSARSGAGAKNLLGVYEVDAAGEIVDVRLVFADTSVSTDPSFTITGVDAGNKLGFFLVFDGADLVTNAATDVFDFVPANGAAGEAFVSAGTALDLTINGTVVSNNIFHSLDTTLNGDGVQHAVSGVQADGNGIDIGFEDLFGGGDRDYQDVVFSVDIV